MSVKILFPPQFEPFQPYLALPYLKSLLSLYGIESHYYDANVEFYAWCFKNKSGLIKNVNNSEQRQYIYNNLDSAINIIKSGKFYPNYKWAINVIETYLSNISVGEFKISLFSLDFARKYDSTLIRQMLSFKKTLIDQFYNDNKLKILDYNAEYYFFSITVIDQFLPALILSKNIKEDIRFSKIVFGGAWIIGMNESLLKLNWLKEYVDIISPHEGFTALSTIFNINTSIIHITPDYSELNFSKYLSPEVVLPYLIANGCKWGLCNFCSHHTTYSAYRSSTVDEVVKDLKQLKKKYGISYISFSDEYIPVKFLRLFSERLILENISIKWSSFVRAEREFTDCNFTKLIYDSGGRVIFFGFETISQRLLNLMQKGNNSSWYRKILESCFDSKISIRLDFMVDYPSETDDEYFETINFIKENLKFIDSPFSSFSIASFELKKDTPIVKSSFFNNSESIPLRGDLDDQLIRPVNETNLEKRREILLMYKHLKAEILTPINKTHQLIYKGYFDDQIFEIPVLDLDDLRKNSNLKISLNDGIKIEEHKGCYILKNFSNGCVLEVSIELEPIIRLLYTPRMVEKIFDQIPEMVHPILNKFLHYLLRTDFITIS